MKLRVTIFEVDSNNVVKVVSFCFCCRVEANQCDFGMSRQMSKDYYKSSNHEVAVRWYSTLYEYTRIDL